MKKRTFFYLSLLFVVSPMVMPVAFCQEKKPIVIGAVQHLTGWAALGGKNVVSGMKIALEKINSSFRTATGSGWISPAQIFRNGIET